MSALHVPTGRNKYCGPTSLSAITGLSKDVCARALRSRSGRAAIKGAYNSELQDALRLLGYTWQGEEISGMTLATWLEQRPLSQRARRVIIQVTGHYLAVCGDNIADSGTTTRPVLLSPEQLNPRVLGKRMVRVWWVDGPAKAELPATFKAQDEAKYKAWLAGQRVRIEAVKLAKSLGFRLERYDRYCIDIMVHDPVVVERRFKLIEQGICADGESLQDCLNDQFGMNGGDYDEVLNALTYLKSKAVA